MSNTQKLVAYKAFKKVSKRKKEPQLIHLNKLVFRKRFKRPSIILKNYKILAIKAKLMQNTIKKFDAISSLGINQVVDKTNILAKHIAFVHHTKLNLKNMKRLPRIKEAFKKIKLSRKRLRKHKKLFFKEYPYLDRLHRYDAFKPSIRKATLQAIFMRRLKKRQLRAAMKAGKKLVSKRKQINAKKL